GGIARRDKRCDGADRHDRSATALAEHAERVLQRQEDAREIDAQDRVPLLERELVRAPAARDPGGGDDGVQATEAVDRLRDPIASVPFTTSRRCVAMIPPMSIDLTKTSDFMAAHARILDRRRFELITGRSDASVLLAALDAYRKPRRRLRLGARA